MCFQLHDTFLVARIIAAQTTAAVPSGGPPDGPDAFTRFMWLLFLLIFLGLLLVTTTWLLFASRRWRRPPKPSRPTRLTDAWAEAGQRAGMIDDDPDRPDDGDLLAPEDQPPL